MKNLSHTIKQISPGQRDEIKKILLLHDSLGEITGKILSSMQSYPGIDLIIANLSVDERKILNAVTGNENGITIGEIEKKVKIEAIRIEHISNNLSNKLLVYVLKNRQKLNNKLDKIYLIPEISDIINPMHEEYIVNYFKNLKEALEENDIPSVETLDVLKKNALSFKLIELIFQMGGVAIIDEIKDLFPQKSFQKILSDLQQKKFINIYHDLNASTKTFLFLNIDIFLNLLTNSSARSSAMTHSDNRYYFLINLLNTYDTISTYGLFLTKQQEFRKIDRKRLDNSMIKLKDINGKKIDPRILSQLSIFFLTLLNCFKITDDSAIISLKEIENLINNPFKLLSRVIKNLQEYSIKNKLLQSPIKIPLYNDFVSLIELIQKTKDHSIIYIERTYFSKLMSELSKEELFDIIKIKKHIEKKFNAEINFLLITGIIKVLNGEITLSDIGVETNELIQHRKVEKNENNKQSNQNIYINPDLTLIIPQKEIPSEALYHILTHTEILKDDVILHTRITRESILKSVKRGMTNVEFFETLKKYSKMEIPANLDFLISEWSSQANRISITTNAALIKVSQPSYIDKILHCNIKDGIIERISQNYAIIDRTYIDKIIKNAKENDAIITILEDSNFSD